MALLAYCTSFIILASFFLQATAFFAFSPGLDHFPYSIRARVRAAATHRAGPRVLGGMSRTDGEVADALFLTGDPLGNCNTYEACQKRLDYHVKRMRKLMKSAAMKARLSETMPSSTDGASISTSGQIDE